MFVGDVGQVDDESFGASADGSGEVQSRGGGRASRQNKAGKGGQRRLERVDPLFEARRERAADSLVIGAGGVGVGERRAECEEVGLDRAEDRVDFVVDVFGPGQSEPGVQFVDGAVGIDPRVVLQDATAAEEPGGAVVAGFRVDLQSSPASSALFDFRRGDAVAVFAALGGAFTRVYTRRDRPEGKGGGPRRRPGSATTRSNERPTLRRALRNALTTLALGLPTLAHGQEAPPRDEFTPAHAAALEAKHLRNIKQLTRGFARAGEGYFSPDGKLVIYQAEPRGQGEYQMFIQESNPDATPRMVSTGKGKCTCGYFHPNGKSIIFGSSHLDPTLTHIPAKPKPKDPAYSRSRNYRWDFDASMDIFRADLDGSHLVRLTDAAGYDAEGSYSPDGREIIFTSYRDGDAEIYVMNADGSKPRRITHSKGYDGGPFFAPDGRRIIYRSDRKGNDMLQIYINTPDGANERALTSNNDVNWGPYFYRDSRHIVYATSRHGHQNYEIYWMDVDTGKEERITYVAGFDGLPVFNRDGTKLMWTSKGRTPNKTSQLFVADFVAPAEATASR